MPRTARVVTCLPAGRYRAKKKTIKNGNRPDLIVHFSLPVSDP